MSSLLTWEQEFTVSSVDVLTPISIHCLYSSHHNWLRHWLQKHLGCNETAADLAQDTFVRILLKESAPSINKPRAYLTTIAKGLMFNHWRHQALEQAYTQWLSEQPELLSPSLEEQQQMLETLIQLEEVLNGLSQRSKQVFLLSRLDGLTYQKIALKLNITEIMVQKAMTKAMHNCYRVLYDHST